MRWLNVLYIRVLIGIAIGIAIGALAPGIGSQLGVLGEIFVRLVKMTIAPLIFCSIVHGIASMASMKSVGKIGGTALVYFEVLSSLALVIGLVMINVVRPGDGVDIKPSATDVAAVGKYIAATPDQPHGLGPIILHEIPNSLIGALTGSDLIPVLIVSMLFGFALQRVGERAQPVRTVIERGGEVVFAVIGMIMELAPIGACGAMAYTVASFGGDALVALAKLMGCFYATCLLFVFVVLGAVARAAGFSIFKFVRYIGSELLLVLGTSSSESALPRLIAKMKRLGAGSATVDLVVPAGYSFNLDGTSIYLTMAAIFLAQATHTPMDLEHQLALLAILLVTSKGAAGVTGAGFITLAATLDSSGAIPATSLAMIFGIDRFMSEARSLTNTVGNGVASLVVARLCGDLDREKLSAELAAGPKEGPKQGPRTSDLGPRSEAEA